MLNKIKKKSEKLSKKTISIFTLLFALILFISLSTASYAAQDFIIENKTSALFVVNGTTRNIAIAPSFANLVNEVMLL